MKSKPHRTLSKNCKAVIDMPLRLTVTIIIGTITLLAILGYMANVSVLPEEIIVEVDAYTAQMTSNNSFQITVTDTKGNPLPESLVIIKGLEQLSSNTTDAAGTTNIAVSCSLNTTQSQGYLDIVVRPPDGYKDYSQEKMIKIYR